MSKALRTKDIEEHRLTGAGPVRAGQKHAYGTIAPQVRAWLDKNGVGEASQIARDLGIDGKATDNGVRAALQRGVDLGVISQPFRGVFALPEVTDDLLDVASAYRDSK